MNTANIRQYLNPEVDAESQAIIDKDSVSNVSVVAASVVFIQTVGLAFFVASRSHFGQTELSSILKVLTTIPIGLVGYFCATRLKRSESIPHRPASVLTTLLYLAFSAWAIWVSHDHYASGEQLTSFFAVELALVCFIPLRPLPGTIVTFIVYAALYAVLWQIDGAGCVNAFNYVILTVVSALGMVVRFHSQLRMADALVKQQRANKLLERMTRQDGLTGLSNRTALKEDAAALLGKHVIVLMADVNYFKEINDEHGHLVGDEVLKEAAQKLRALFPDGVCYRFGGDEFLVICAGSDVFEGDTFTFHSDAIEGGEVLLSIGRAEGDLLESGELFDLMGKADASLYEIKRRTHSPEFGGHDRRRSAATR